MRHTHTDPISIAFGIFSAAALFIVGATQMGTSPTLETAPPPNNDRAAQDTYNFVMPAQDYMPPPEDLLAPNYSRSYAQGSNALRAALFAPQKSLFSTSARIPPIAARTTGKSK